MKTRPLVTCNTHVRLIEPDIERDAALGVQWLDGIDGRKTLKLMGVTDADNKPTSLEQERERVRGFIERNDQLNWMIAYDEQVVGSVWVDLKPSAYLKAPSIHIMIGDPAMRGKGVGSASMYSVIGYLRKRGTENIYSRYQGENIGSARLLDGLGFQKDGKPYEDADGLRFQNVILP